MLEPSCMSEVRQRRRPVVAGSMNGWAEAIRNLPPVIEQPANPVRSSAPEWHHSVLRDASANLCIIGLDLSLTSTGIAVLNGPGITSRSLEPKKLMGAERLSWFYHNVISAIRLYEPTLVVLESYAHEAKFGREQAGELGGVVRLALHEMGARWITYAPSQLKKFATGSGKSDKSIVARELYKRYGVDAEGNDEVDACGLALMGAAHLGYRVTLTVAQREAIAKIDK
jgi:Holliday junction resolvasome RuvABC endonuclease subunit